jgi:hypothetical protein
VQGGYEARTRVQSLPSDFGIEQQLSQDDNLLPIFEDDNLVAYATSDIGTASGDLTSTGLIPTSGTCNVANGDVSGSDPIYKRYDPDVTINGFNVSTHDSVGANKTLVFEWNCQLNIWICTFEDCDA